jgi:hypothetical protein
MSISTYDPGADTQHDQVQRARRLRATLAQRLRMLRWLEHDERRHNFRSGYVCDEQTTLAIAYVEAAMAALTRVACATTSHRR